MKANHTYDEMHFFLAELKKNDARRLSPWVKITNDDDGHRERVCRHHQWFGQWFE